MAHYDIFREELAQKFHAYGHALWEPSPGELYGPVAIGDVGYIRRGKFHRIFNVLLPEDHPTHANFRTPEYHEPLQLKMENHIDTGILSPNDFCSAEVRVVSGGLNIFSLRPEGSAEASFECSKRRGALLSIPVPARREDTVAQGQFAEWITKNIDSWFSFAHSLGLGLDMEEIVLVTGCHRTRTYTNILFSESRDGARVSFGVRVGPSGADITWEVSREQIREVQIQRGPSGDNLSEDQCIFVRGFRVTRFMGIFPTRLRAAAGPAPLAGSDSHSHPSDKQLMSHQSLNLTS
ncbi:hypothetical protein BGY98DRAFT_244928 [Russula aff. rugulosa BPL654]|nr:hypothetical protein BGY98DRAFT_244928 [Russula aff. rugulosa BPL654]